MSELRILDMTAGNRACWFNRQDPRGVFVDKRSEVSPTVVADSCALPAEITGPFDHVVFDPPHKPNGKHFGMARSYGSSTMEEIISLVRGGSKEAWRVTREGALMSFKWNDHHKKFASVLALMEPYWLPILAHGISPQQARSKTFWSLLVRNDKAADLSGTPQP